VEAGFELSMEMSAQSAVGNWQSAMPGSAGVGT
jgi:hypothetical protein